MSHILNAVLRMPPDLWDNTSKIEIMQRHVRCVEAADLIEELTAENELLKNKFKPLTDEEIATLRHNDNGKLNFVTLREFKVIARVIEQAHSIFEDTQ